MASNLFGVSFLKLNRYGLNFALEALAATQAIELALELGFDRIIFESDSDIVMRPLTDHSPSFAPFGLLNRNALVFVAWLSWVKFQYIGRDGNNVTHNLARYARHVTNFSLLMKNISFHCFNVY